MVLTSTREHFRYVPICSKPAEVVQARLRKIAPSRVRWVSNRDISGPFFMSPDDVCLRHGGNWIQWAIEYTVPAFSSENSTASQSFTRILRSQKQRSHKKSPPMRKSCYFIFLLLLGIASAARSEVSLYCDLCLSIVVRFQDGASVISREEWFRARAHSSSAECLEVHSLDSPSFPVLTPVHSQLFQNAKSGTDCTPVLQAHPSMRLATSLWVATLITFSSEAGDEKRSARF